MNNLSTKYLLISFKNYNIKLYLIRKGTEMSILAYMAP